MKQVILREDTDNLYLDQVPEDTPIFVKKMGVLIGMVVKIDEGWIISHGRSYHGIFSSRRGLIRNTLGNTELGFFVEDKEFPYPYNKEK